MEGNISYNIAALILLCVTLIVFIVKKKINLLQNKMFTLLIIVCILSTAFDIADIVTTASAAEYPKWVWYVTSYAFFFFHNFTAFIFFLYVISLAEIRISRMRKISIFCLLIPLIIEVAMLIINDFTGAIFTYMADGTYMRGGYQFILYTCSAFYMVYGAICYRVFKVRIPRGLQYALCSFVVIEVIACIIQLTHPGLYVENFGAAISIVTILLTVQKPEEFLDPVMGVFNKGTFAKLYDVNLKKEKKFNVLLVFIEDVALLNQAVGINKMNQLLKQMGSYFESLVGNRVFYLNASTFALMVAKKDSDEMRSLMKKIDTRFDSKWGTDDCNMYITNRMMNIHVPTDGRELETIYSYADYLRGLDNSKKWILEAANVSLNDNQRKIAIENCIKNAIENDLFEVKYQPIYNLHTDRITSAEALVRMTDKELGAIPPDEFIPIAEQNGTILKIGEMVFEKVCRFIHDNDTQSKGIEYIEINLSVVQCMQETLAMDLLKIMEKYGIENSRINLEITETAAVHSPKMLIRNMKILFDHGVSFSLDDFGTGYSNINSLMDLPLDMIKFDKSMVDSATMYDKGKIILGSAIAMIKKMDLKIVAEGVEEKEQIEMLSQMGVDFLQGYFFSKPIPGEDFIKYIDSFHGKDMVTQ